MLVSLAVITLALSIVGVVFSITTKTVSQASAYSETLTLVRQCLHEIEQDLEDCEPSKSVLVLVGRSLEAALTADDCEAGVHYRVLTGDRYDAALLNYDPKTDANLDPNLQYSDLRADIMMFFTNRPVMSRAPPLLDATPDDVGVAAAMGAKFAPIQVVYAHAALAKPYWNGNQFQFPPEASAAPTMRHIEQVDPATGLSIVPATQWQLSRRQTIIAHPTDAAGLSKFAFNSIDRPRIVRCEPAAGMPGDAVYLNLPLLLAGFGPIDSATTPAVRFTPYDLDDNAWSTTPSIWNLSFRQCIDDLLYFDGVPGAVHHVATVLEETPVELRSNMGNQLLPGCVWFQVEFLMPEDPRNSIYYSDDFQGDPNDASRRSDMPHWKSVESGKTYVFVPDTRENREAIEAQTIPVTGVPLPGSRLESFGRLDQTDDAAGEWTAISNRVIRTWPYAIRVTVRAFDRQGRLEQPIVRTLVHRFD